VSELSSFTQLLASPTETHGQGWRLPGDWERQFSSLVLEMLRQAHAGDGSGRTIVRLELTHDEFSFLACFSVLALRRHVVESQAVASLRDAERLGPYHGARTVAGTPVQDGGPDLVVHAHG